MIDFFFREGGVQYSANTFFTGDLEKYSQLISIAEYYISEKLDDESRPTEIVFVKYPFLGDELFKDKRINTKKLDNPKEHYNNFGGVAIYVKDKEDQNQILKEEYRNLRISYISIIQHYGIIENLLGIIHELNHFRDPYSSAVNFVTSFCEGGYNQDTRLFIQFNVKNILNEYYANYRTYKYMKDVLEILQIEEFNLYTILKQSFYNLKASMEHSKNKLVELKKLEGSYPRFVDYLNLCFKFFEIVFKLFGKWHGLKKDWQDLEDIFNTLWKQVKKKFENSSLHFLLIYIDSIELRLSPDLKKTNSLDEFYNLFYLLADEYKEMLNSKIDQN